nr:prepilin peptidase [Pseudomonadota bacterium]
MGEALAWPLALGVAGAIVGSFLATLVIRWPQGRSVLHGRSHCDACDVVLRPRDLVPLLSAVWTRGRCRH